MNIYALLTPLLLTQSEPFKEGGERRKGGENTQCHSTNLASHRYIIEAGEKRTSRQSEETSPRGNHTES